ncbi:sigma-70 family RNA polymerase sigma factor, partial [Patescibacteria group bacterium]|nr:sigma-70 family RNA polymerase sigma factor [Patescibacteria group bacterium]
KQDQDYRTPGFSYSDILSAGALGLRRAALHFDHTLGFRFSTYAKSWIKQGIIRSFDDYSRSIRLPVDVSQDLVRYIKVCTRFQLENVEEPSDEVVAQQMNVTMDRLQEVKAVHQTQQILSLNWVVSHSDDVDDGVDGKGANFDMIQGRMRMLAGERDNESTIEEQYMRCELRAELLYAMNMAGLTEPEKKILLLMHGFVNDKPLSRAEAGRCCEVDEGQARYLVKRALRKLRSKDLLERLEVYREQ